MQASLDDYNRELDLERRQGTLASSVSPTRSKPFVLTPEQIRHVVSLMHAARTPAGVAATSFIGSAAPVGLGRLVAYGLVRAASAYANRRREKPKPTTSAALAIALAQKLNRPPEHLQNIWKERNGLPGEALLEHSAFDLRLWSSMAKAEGPLGPSDDYGHWWTGFIARVEATCRDVLCHEPDAIWDTVLEAGRNGDRRYLEQGRERGMTLSQVRLWVKLLEISAQRRAPGVEDHLVARIGFPDHVLRGNELSSLLNDLLKIRNPLAHGRPEPVSAVVSANRMRDLVGTQRFLEWWTAGTRTECPWVRLVAGHSLVQDYLAA